MNKTIVIAGATGNLGGKIVDALLALRANVKAIVRMETDKTKIVALESKGVIVAQINMADKNAVAAACQGAACFVSAIAGLRDTIVDAQLILLEGAALAKVPRFIPSDFSTDFTNLTPGKNRNLDARRDFHTYLNKADIKATSIFNGAFMELLTTDMPLILFAKKRILCWGNPSIKMDFTNTLNIATYTANAALDEDTPRYLHIAGASKSANDVKEMMSTISNENYKLFKPGGIGLFNIIINIAKFFDRKKTELYPAWQGMQYMRDMMEGKAALSKHDNVRYKMSWINMEEYIVSEKK